jgi:hypothetical protein
MADVNFLSVTLTFSVETKEEQGKRGDIWFNLSKKGSRWKHRS